MSRATLARLIGAMFLLGTVMSVVLTQINWNGDAGSTQADKVDTLLDVMIILSSYVFSIVMVMMGYCIWRYRAKPGDEGDGEPIHGNTKLEIAWTLIPTIVVLFGAGYSIVVLDQTTEAKGTPLEIHVTAQQYEWTFDYPDPDHPGQTVTAHTLHVPVNQEIEFQMNALDVIHSFFVPEWRVKKDLVPGLTTSLIATPDQEGTFSLECTELCGWGHATMRAFVVVEPQSDYDAWVAKLPATPDNGPSAQAQKAATQTE
jgi:cytochrome c oxidase subunit II